MQIYLFKITLNVYHEKHTVDTKYPTDNYEIFTLKNFFLIPDDEF